DIVADQGATVRVTWPFLPSSWTAGDRLNDPCAVFDVLRMSAKSIVLVTHDPRGFVHDVTGAVPKDYCWHLRTGESSIPLATKTCTGDSFSARIWDQAVAVTTKDDIGDRVVLIQPLLGSDPQKV